MNISTIWQSTRRNPERNSTKRQSKRDCEPLGVEEWFHESDARCLSVAFMAVETAASMAENGIEFKRNTVFKPEELLCTDGNLFSKTIENNFTRISRDPSTHQISTSFQENMRIFLQGLRPLWTKQTDGRKHIDLFETLVKACVVLPVGQLMYHQMNFTNWSKSTSFEEKWEFEYGLWFTPLIDENDTYVQYKKAVKLQTQRSHYGVCVMRPIAGILNIDTLEPYNGRNRDDQTAFRTAIELFDIVCQSAKPLRDSSPVTSETCMIVEQAKQKSESDNTRDKYFPSLIEKGFRGWVLKYERKLERQIMLCQKARVHACNFWKLDGQNVPPNLPFENIIHRHILPIARFTPFHKEDILKHEILDFWGQQAVSSQQIYDLFTLFNDQLYALYSTLLRMKQKHVEAFWAIMISMFDYALQDVRGIFVDDSNSVRTIIMRTGEISTFLNRDQRNKDMYIHMLNTITRRHAVRCELSEAHIMAMINSLPMTDLATFSAIISSAIVSELFDISQSIFNIVVVTRSKEFVFELLKQGANPSRNPDILYLAMRSPQLFDRPAIVKALLHPDLGEKRAKAYGYDTWMGLSALKNPKIYIQDILEFEKSKRVASTDLITFLSNPHRTSLNIQEIILKYPTERDLIELAHAHGQLDNLVRVLENAESSSRV